MEFNLARGAQSEIPGMGRLPGVFTVFQRDLSIRQTYLYAKNEIITRFYYASHVRVQNISVAGEHHQTLCLVSRIWLWWRIHFDARLAARKPFWPITASALLAFMIAMIMNLLVA